MALCLSRRIGQTITIEDVITITIVAVKGKQVQVAIEAPKELKILRGELCDSVEPV